MHVVLSTLKHPATALKIVLLAYHSGPIVHVVVVLMIVGAKVDTTRDTGKRSRCHLVAPKTTFDPVHIVTCLRKKTRSFTKDTCSNNPISVRKNIWLY